MAEESSMDDDVKFAVMMIIGCLLMAAAILFATWIAADRRHEGPGTPRPTVSTSQAPRTASVPARGYQGTGYPACRAEDGSGTTSPCVLDCDSVAMIKWCASGRHGLWLRWNDGPADRPLTVATP